MPGRLLPGAFWLFLPAALGATSGCGDARPYTVAVVLDSLGIEGAALAAARINVRGGIDGHRLLLRTVAGAERTARISLATAQSLAEDASILAVVGHTSSASSLSASQVYNARKLVQISPMTTAPLYGEAGPYSFRMVPSDVHQGAFLVDAALRDRTLPRIAVVFVNSDYGRPLRDVVLDQLRAHGTLPVLDEPFDAVDSAGGPILAASLARAKPDVLIWIGRSADLNPIAPAVREALPRVSVIASDAFSRRLPAHDTRHLFDNVSYVRFVDVGRADYQLQALLSSYRGTHGTEATDQTLLAYDAVNLLAEALRATGPHREAIRLWLNGVGAGGRTFTGVTGPVSFATSRERAPAYVMVGVKP